MDAVLEDRRIEDWRKRRAEECMERLRGSEGRTMKGRPQTPNYTSSGTHDITVPTIKSTWLDMTDRGNRHPLNEC